ncbi:MAG: hypothetical protein IPJ89_04610 [Candidatus Iainarchaeum archaeon]|uniref:Thioredoxin family protein n=1 Tax=Candidatus Iainarchaeum sp. TaxID=3101447 RepID=A0A7T9DJD2_9ARCH|nr:MAG: hypothetical protein IPJ89_04610 [Candidatus Diapherotrites archaeon]
MVLSVYWKALIMTLLILGAWALLSSTFESQRNAHTLEQIDSIITQENAINAYLDYVESTGNEARFCTVLQEHIELQNEKLFSLLESLEETRYNTLDNQYQLARQRFQSANAQLYFSLKRYELKCPRNELRQPILYFYSDNEGCIDCGVQAQVLDQLRETCSHKLQIFAFPIEGGIVPIELLVKDYNILTAPTLVIDENKYEGVQSPSALNGVLACGEPTNA